MRVGSITCMGNSATSGPALKEKSDIGLTSFELFKLQLFAFININIH